MAAPEMPQGLPGDGVAIMNIKGFRGIWAIGALAALVAGAPALAQSHGGGHSGGGAHFSGGGGGHFSGGHASGGGHFGLGSSHAFSGAHFAAPRANYGYHGGTVYGGARTYGGSYAAARGFGGQTF
ncbi:MAG: hypothetical protein JOY91_08410, partial [Sinobacteraceae bacterium]|nr:hypothetical protein [Nevskiaceae bacterium]